MKLQEEVYYLEFTIEGIIALELGMWYDSDNLPVDPEKNYEIGINKFTGDQVLYSTTRHISLS